MKLEKRILVLLAALLSTALAFARQEGRLDPSEAQLKLLNRLSLVWAECLAPHFGTHGEQELATGIQIAIRDQIHRRGAERAQACLLDFVRAELGMSDRMFRLQGGEAAIVGAGVLEDLMNRAASTPGSTLQIRGILGLSSDQEPGFTPATLRRQQEVEQGKSLEHYLDLVLVRNQALESLLYGFHFAELQSKEQRLGVKELWQFYAADIQERLALDAPKAARKTFEKLLSESLETTHGDRAVTGARSKTRALLRSALAVPSDAEAPYFLSREPELALMLDARYSAGFWETLRIHHKRMVERPESYRKEFKAWTKQPKELRPEVSPEPDGSSDDGKSLTGR